MTSRNQSLDVLRGVAILLVLGIHVPYFRMWVQIGWIGVDLFFVLSGFLISGLLFDEYKRTGAIDFRRFILRRGFRIWPPFYVLAAMLIAISCFSPLFKWRSVVYPLLFLQSYATRVEQSMIGLTHSWSLAVEEHFYLLLPVLLFVLLKVSRRNPFRFIPHVFVVIAVLSLWLRFMNSGDAWKSHLRMDELFTGVTLGYFYHFKEEIFRRFSFKFAPLLCAACVLPTFFLTQGSRPMKTWGLSLLAGGFGFLIAWAIVRTPVTAFKPFAWLGVYSYSIYLWHYPIALVMREAGRKSLLAYAAYLAISIGIGISMAKLVELPSIRLRNRLLASSRPPRAASLSQPIPGMKVCFHVCDLS